MSKTDEIVGKKIKKIFVSAGDNDILRLDFEDEIVYWGTYGDCCSVSWWNDVIGANSCYGGTIAKVETLEMPDYWNEYEFIQPYGVDIYTEKGVINLIFRNASNGYYGGWFEKLNSKPNETNWIEIDKNDWRSVG